jgi:hypothetical protein
MSFLAFFHLYIYPLTQFLQKLTFRQCDLAIKIVVLTDFDTPGGQMTSKTCPTELKLGPWV